MAVRDAAVDRPAERRLKSAAANAGIAQRRPHCRDAHVDDGAVGEAAERMNADPGYLDRDRHRRR